MGRFLVKLGVIWIVLGALAFVCLAGYYVAEIFSSTSMIGAPIMAIFGVFAAARQVSAFIVPGFILLVIGSLIRTDKDRSKPKDQGMVRESTAENGETLAQWMDKQERSRK